MKMGKRKQDKTQQPSTATILSRLREKKGHKHEEAKRKGGEGMPRNGSKQTRAGGGDRRSTIGWEHYKVGT